VSADNTDAGCLCKALFCFFDDSVIRALENEQDDRAKVNGLFGSLNS
jgi:hypothetical protein